MLVIYNQIVALNFFRDLKYYNFQISLQQICYLFRKRVRFSMLVVCINIFYNNFFFLYKKKKWNYFFTLNINIYILYVYLVSMSNGLLTFITSFMYNVYNVFYHLPVNRSSFRHVPIFLFSNMTYWPMSNMIL